MSKIMNWFLGFTKLGKVNDWVRGNRSTMASVATALVGLSTIITKFSEQGLGYLPHLGGSPEFLAFSGGMTALFLALKGQRIETKLAEPKPEAPKPS